MEQKSDRRVRMTRRMLRESLIKLMNQKPLARITVKELCETADINRGTFYAHYGCPFDLLCDIEREVMDDVLSRLSAIGGGVRPAAPAQAVLAVLEYIRANADTFRVLLSGEPGGQLPLLVHKAVEERFLPASAGEDAVLARYRYAFIVSGVLSIVRRWLQSGADVPAPDMARMIVSQIENGLYAEYPRAGITP